ncbi:MAG: alcohol dehydrogenase catalytic domain-containing protein [Deltaproteobacteria bacterium]
MTSVDEVIRRQVGREPGRFEIRAGDEAMIAVVTTGNGGFETLDVREVRRPRPDEGEVLVRVLAAGVNATDVNTRVGWYEAGGWSAPSPFPFIQGTDCCGVVEEVGPGGDATLVGRRVLIRPCMRPHGFSSPDTLWLGSDFDGAFAQYVLAPASEVYPVSAGLSDVELGAVPCSFGTAENMLLRAGVRGGHHVVVSGASGGVGSAAVQLARLRGADVTAITSGDKAGRVLALGADRVVDRADDPAAVLGEQSADVVVDNVSGPGLDRLLTVLRRDGVYVTSGAVAGPQVSFDKRTLYLRDLRLIGCTAWDEPVFPALVGRIEAGELHPPVATTFPLERIAEAQAAFLEKRHVGSFVLVPPASS